METMYKIKNVKMYTINSKILFMYIIEEKKLEIKPNLKQI